MNVLRCVQIMEAPITRVSTNNMSGWHRPCPKPWRALFTIAPVSGVGFCRADKESKAMRAEVCSFKDGAAKLRARLACVQGRRQAEHEQVKRKIEVRLRARVRFGAGLGLGPQQGLGVG